MGNKVRIKEKIAVFVLIVVLVGFLGGFGYLIKTELIDGNGKLSYSVKKMTENNQKNKKETNKTDETNKEIEVKDKDEIKIENEESDEVTDSTNNKGSTNKKDETDVELKGDGKVYKAYPIVTCKNSTPIDNTEVTLDEEYNFYFDTDGSMNWIKFDMIIDYSKFPAVYDVLWENGFFDQMTEAFSDITIATVVSKTKFSLAFELKPEEFIEEVDDSPFKTTEDLHYDTFEKKIKKEGYTCTVE